MLKDKKELEKYLDVQCDKIVIDTKQCRAVYNYANETYDIPKGYLSDIVTKRVSISEATEFVLFILLDSLHNVLNKEKMLSIESFYTEQEIQYYKKSKFENQNIKFPLVFKMIKVDKDQWTGSIDVKTLMKLRQAQLINYNVNAQRTMQKVVKGDKESYKITLNQKAINEISSSYLDSTFIPNTITLNIPMEDDYDFYYNEETCSLIIKSLKHFDITDGYHRYIAACQVSDTNKDFNYNMELRIVNFTEDKAKQFIFQEDQKTKMRRMDSNSLNMNKAANIVVERLNESVRFNLKGLVTRNEGIINFGELSELVDYFYFKNKGIGKEKERSVILQAVKEITENLNMLTEYNPNHLEQRMDYRTLLAAMFCFDYFKEDISGDELCEIIEKTANALKNSDSNKFNNKTPRKSLMNEVEIIMKGAI